jgi:hypothetical protein
MFKRNETEEGIVEILKLSSRKPSLEFLLNLETPGLQFVKNSLLSTNMDI